MNNSLHDGPEIKEQRCDKSFGSNGDATTNEETSMPIKDPDTTLSMIVLLVACLALAALAHVLV